MENHLSLEKTQSDSYLDHFKFEKKCLKLLESRKFCDRFC